MSIENQVKEILSMLLEEQVNDETSMLNCEKWDSMKHIEIITTLEEELDVSFEVQDIPKLVSYKLLIEKIKGIKDDQI